jgi:hypothetical protein
MNSDHHFDGNRDSFPTYRSRLQDCLSMQHCKLGYNCWGTLNGEPQNHAVTGSVTISTSNQAENVRRNLAWGILINSFADQGLADQIKRDYSAQPATATAPARPNDPRGAWLYLLRLYDIPLNNTEISEKKLKWAMVQVEDVGSSDRTPELIYQRLMAIAYDLPEQHRPTNPETATKMLQCFAKFDSHMRSITYKEINQPDGQRGRNEVGTQVLDEDGAVVEGEFEPPFTLSLQMVREYYGKLWSSRIKDRDLPQTEPSSKISTRGAAYPARVVRGSARRPTRNEAFAVRVRLPASEAGELDRAASLSALYAAGCTEVDNGFATTSDFADIDVEELKQALRDGGVLDGCFSISTVQDADGVDSIEVVCYNCFGLGHTARSCTSPKKQRVIEFVVKTLNDLAARRKNNASKLPARQPYGQKTGQQRKPFPPRQPKKFTATARTAEDGEYDSCDECEEELGRSARVVERAASAYASTSSARLPARSLAFTGASPDDFFPDEATDRDETLGEGDAGYGPFKVHGAYSVKGGFTAPVEPDLPPAPPPELLGTALPADETEAPAVKEDIVARSMREWRALVALFYAAEVPEMLVAVPPKMLATPDAPVAVAPEMAEAAPPVLPAKRADVLDQKLAAATPEKHIDVLEPKLHREPTLPLPEVPAALPVVMPRLDILEVEKECDDEVDDATTSSDATDESAEHY